MLDGENFENFISLGYFCEVASDLEKLGLRNTSSPFDWCITDFQMNIKLIENHFEGFMNLNNLSQSSRNRNIYMDKKYKDFFFHDFSKYKSLANQYPSVKAKYDRRIKRFLSNIKQPTLFIRYISNEKKNKNEKSTELVWIEENQDYILKVLKRYNPKNEIIYIGDYDTKSEIIKIFHVQKDKNDAVSRKPIYNNRELYPIMKNMHIRGQKENIERFLKKEKAKKSFNTRSKKKVISIYNGLFKKTYKHTREYDIAGR